MRKMFIICCIFPNELMFQDKDTPIHRAVLGNHLDVAVFLISNEADINASDKVRERTLQNYFIYVEHIYC